jgi:hypothetical protein
VAVAYGVTADPVAAGFDVIPSLPFDIALCRGYPNIHAAIEAHGESGYRGLCGWIQVFTGERYRGGNDDAAPAQTGGGRALAMRADTFLATVPLESRDEVIRRLAGLRWGYPEYDPASHPRWRRCLWRFAAAA